MHLALIPADGGAETVLPGPGALTRADLAGRAGLVAIVAAGETRRLAALRAIARDQTEGLTVTAGAREMLAGRPDLGFGWLGRGRDAASGIEVELWQLLGPGRALAAPQRREVLASASIAILPFRAPDGPPEMRDRAEGLSDDVTIALTRFRALSVRGRDSVIGWRASALPAREIGAALGVERLLTGVLRRQGTELRLDLALIETATGRAVWADRYLRAPDRLFGLSGDIAERIAAAVAGHGEAAGPAGIAQAGPADGRAHDLCLQATARLARGREEDLGEAAALAEAACDLDPRHGPAWALRARVALAMRREGPARGSDRLVALARSHAARAVRADPLDARAACALGEAALAARDYPAAEAALEAALALNPADPATLAAIAASFAHLGRAEEGLRLIERAMVLDPHFPDLYLLHQGEVLMTLRRHDEALRAFLRMQEPDRAGWPMVAALGWTGRAEAAAELAARLAPVDPAGAARAWLSARPDRNPADTDHLAEGLRRAGPV